MLRMAGSTYYYVDSKPHVYVFTWQLNVVCDSRLLVARYRKKWLQERRAWK